MTQNILEGIVVLDVASYIAGPVATTVMADFGADVIKIEPPAGDAYRWIVDNPGMPECDTEFHWHATNRNKRGVCLDLVSAAGRGALDRLIGRADVLVTNFPSGARSKLGLNYDDVRAVNDRLIYASLSAYGERGDEAASPGFDSTAYWARSGLMHMVRPDPAGGPARSAPGQGDHPSGIALFGAVMLALYDRQRTGRGSHAHTSLLANGLWANAFNAQAALSEGTVPLRPRREAMGNALTNHYRTSDDRWFILAVLNQARDWPRLLQATDTLHLKDDPRFATREARNANGPALCKILDQVFVSHDLGFWRSRLRESGLTLGLVGTNEDIPGDQQMIASGSLRATDPAAETGSTYMVDSPLWVEGISKQAVARAPAIGEHTLEVLEEAGFSQSEIDVMAAAGAFGR